MGIRSDLKAHLEAALGDGIVVYDTGVDLVAVPCVVINPADPYRIPQSMGQDAAVQVALNLTLVTQRSIPSAALEALEAMADTVTAAIKTFTPAGRWTAFGEWHQVEIGGTDYAAAVVESLFLEPQRGT